MTRVTHLNHRIHPNNNSSNRNRNNNSVDTLRRWRRSSIHQYLEWERVVKEEAGTVEVHRQGSSSNSNILWEVLMGMEQAVKEISGVR